MTKQIEEIDKNFKSINEKLKDVHFRSCFDSPFSLHGFYNPAKEKRFLRLPPQFEENERVNEGVRQLMHNTAGGRVRFKTDSKYVAIRATLKKQVVLPRMTACATMGFDMYVKPDSMPIEPTFSATFLPSLEPDGVSFSGVHHFTENKKVMKDITINFPLYAEVSNLYIGLEENANIKAPTPYTIKQPVVFYGSSITQGACSSRPGNCYNAILSRKLDFDMINLGFSGSAYGEKEIAEYIAGLKMSAFVLDYDYNARSSEELSNTHFAFYQTVRSKNADLPIIMLSAPIVAPTRLVVPNKPLNLSRVIIMESYIKGFRNGDKNLYFIDGEALLGDIDAKDALVDNVHPTDMGFKYMANRIYPVLKDVLY